jgi:NDP-mannose synthase
MTTHPASTAFDRMHHGSSAMKAILLVGGLGTRLRPLTFSIPKPLLPVGERPILQLILEQLRAADVQDVVLATGYQAELIQAFCGDGARFGVRLGYVHEDQPLGTAGPLSLIRDRVRPDEHLLLMNGDILTTLDFRAFITAAAASGRELTVGYTTYTYNSPFGVLSIAGDVVAGIVEKPATEYQVSAGIYCLKGSALAWVPDRRFFAVPDLIRALTAAGRPVGAYHIPGLWMGLENVDDFESAVKALHGAPGRPPEL